MSEEIKNETQEIKKEKNILKNEFLQKTLAVAIGSFIGVYGAFNLFFITHKPPVMKHHHFNNSHIEHHIHEKMQRGEHHKPPREFERQGINVPFDAKAKVEKEED